MAARPALLRAGLLAAALLACEAALRLADALDHGLLDAGHPGVGRITAASPDPELIYTYRPSTSRTNSHGYIDREHALEKPAGVFRIVVIGDSVAEGMFVSTDASFPRVLEDLLNASLPPRRFEVILLARAGYSTSQELVLLRKEAFLYTPDLVVWSYVLNDPAHPIYQNANGQLGRYYYRPRLHLVHAAARLWFLLRETIRGLGMPGDYHRRLVVLHWQEVEGAIGDIGRTLGAHRVPGVFVVQPLILPGSYRDYPLRDLHEKLDGAARKAGLVPLDLLSAYSRHAPTDLGTVADPWHPDERGYRVEAEFLADELRRLGLVPAA